ncbi:MAG: amidohydrolase family protein [Betaproteobacteria bacterium]
MWTLPDGTVMERDSLDLRRTVLELEQATHLGTDGMVDKIVVRGGTPQSGLELVRELELYVQAGFTPAEALEAATIEPARNVGADTTTGSIAVGKAAVLDLVEGDPSHRISDLRNTRVVMMDGKLMDADALRAASGVSGRPEMARWFVLLLMGAPFAAAQPRQPGRWRSVIDCGRPPGGLARAGSPATGYRV